MYKSINMCVCVYDSKLYSAILITTTTWPLDLNAPRFEGALRRERGHLGQQRVLAAQPDPLGRGGRVQLELHLHARRVAPRRTDGVLDHQRWGQGSRDHWPITAHLDGVEHGGREEQRRLAHGFAGVDCAGVWGAAQQTHGQVRRHVVKTRDLVRARTWARGHDDNTTISQYWKGKNTHTEG